MTATTCRKKLRTFRIVVSLLLLLANPFILEINATEDYKSLDPSLLKKNKFSSDKKLRINLVLLGSTGNLAEKYLWQSLFEIYKTGLDDDKEIYVYPAATRSKVFSFLLVCSGDGRRLR